jgi:hypothetical protein
VHVTRAVVKARVRKGLRRGVSALGKNFSQALQTIIVKWFTASFRNKGFVSLEFTSSFTLSSMLFSLAECHDQANDVIKEYY